VIVCRTAVVIVVEGSIVYNVAVVAVTVADVSLHLTLHATVIAPMPSSRRTAAVRSLPLRAAMAPSSLPRS
jgi:hypothetical protein